LVAEALHELGETPLDEPDEYAEQCDYADAIHGWQKSFVRTRTTTRFRWRCTRAAQLTRTVFIPAELHALNPAKRTSPVGTMRPTRHAVGILYRLLNQHCTCQRSWLQTNFKVGYASTTYPFTPLAGTGLAQLASWHRHHRVAKKRPAKRRPKMRVNANWLVSPGDLCAGIHPICLA